MLYISKMKPTAVITDEVNKIKRSDLWHLIPKDDVNAIRAQFDSLPKANIREALFKEQHGLCAYCMRRISLDGQNTTIEHWYPLSKSKEKALDYSNMLGVCHGGRKSKESMHRVLCCDASKDEQLITIDPFNKSHMDDIAYILHIKRMVLYILYLVMRKWRMISIKYCA